MVNGGRRCKHCIYSSKRYLAYDRIFCNLYDKMVKLDFAERCIKYDTLDMRYAKVKMQTRLPYLHDWMILEAIEAHKTSGTGPTPAEIWNRIRSNNPIIETIVAANPVEYQTKFLYWQHTKEKCNEMVDRGILRRCYTFGGSITYSHYVIK